MLHVALAIALALGDGRAGAAELTAPPFEIDRPWWNHVLRNDLVGRIKALRLTNGTWIPIVKLLGSGNVGVVYHLPNPPCVLKLTSNSKPKTDGLFLEEKVHANWLSRLNFDVAKIISTQSDGAPYLIKRMIDGPSFKQVREAGFDDEHLEALAFVYSLGRMTGAHPDIFGSTFSNLIWDPRICRWVLVDCGLERCSIFFQDLSLVTGGWFSRRTIYEHYLENVFDGRGEWAERFRGHVNQMSKSYDVFVPNLK